MSMSRSAMSSKWMSRSATPATPNAGRCLQVLRLPRETKVDVTKCNACHANEMSMSQSATPGTQMARQCHQVPRLPRKVANIANGASVSRSATPATEMKCQCHEVPRATKGDEVPRLPRQTQVDVSKCCACHVKRRWMSRSATPATQSGAAPRATNGAQCHLQQVPRLPRQTDRRVIHVQLPTDIGLPPYLVGLCTRFVYGLAGAPRRWWNRLDKFLISLGIQPTRADRCTYICVL